MCLILIISCVIWKNLLSIIIIVSLSALNFSSLYHLWWRFSIRVLQKVVNHPFLSPKYHISTMISRAAFAVCVDFRINLARKSKKQRRKRWWEHGEKLSSPPRLPPAVPGWRRVQCGAKEGEGESRPVVVDQKLPWPVNDRDGIRPLSTSKVKTDMEAILNLSSCQQNKKWTYEFNGGRPMLE